VIIRKDSLELSKKFVMYEDGSKVFKGKEYIGQRKRRRKYKETDKNKMKRRVARTRLRDGRGIHQTCHKKN